MQNEKPKTLRQLEEEARQAHFARIRHVAATCDESNQAERERLVRLCESMYAEDLRKAESDYWAQKRPQGFGR